MGEWLEQRSVDDAWQLAGTLVDGGVTIADLESLGSHVSDTALPSAIRWIEALVDSARLSQHLRSASTRISELVQSVKTYSHMDRATERKRCRSARAWTAPW
jgi:hypothetical protein